MLNAVFWIFLPLHTLTIIGAIIPAFVTATIAVANFKPLTTFAKTCVDAHAGEPVSTIGADLILYAGQFLDWLSKRIRHGRGGQRPSETD